MRPVCLNCKRPRAMKGRGLCWSCYDTPRVRRRFPAIDVGRRAPTDAPPPGPAGLPEPTGVPPGPDKVAVLADRFERRLSLWHPLDARSA
jgi:hypothetical protein